MTDRDWHDDIDPDIREWLPGYAPEEIEHGKPLAADRWFGSNVQEFVVDALSQLPLTDLSLARRRALYLARIGMFTLRENNDRFGADGPPLDVEEVLHPENVERYATYFEQIDAKASVRSVLKSLGRNLTVEAPWKPRPEPLRERAVAASYTELEVDRLVRDSRLQATELRERSFRTFLALGLGVGLDGRWSPLVTGTDVEVVDGVTLVTVGEPAPRTVPVNVEWEDEVRQLARNAGDELMMGGNWYRNATYTRAKSFDLGVDSPHVNLARLRSTWIVRNIRRRVRLPELARAAGLEGLTTLTDLLDEVGDLDDDAFNAELRGA